MEFSDTQELYVLTNPTENSSPFYLLEQGLHYIQQGHHAKGVIYFALACEHLSAQHAHLAAALDDFEQGYAVYWQAQQQLQHASKHFVEVDTAQKTRLAAIEKMLPGLKNQTQQTPPVPQPTPVQAQLQANGKQLRVAASSQPDSGESSNTLPALYFTCFGRFQVRRLNQLLTLCSNRNGQAMLRYLVVQPDRCATMDALMEAFWPNDEPDIAHHKLQVAASALRRSLNGNYYCDAGCGYVLCKRQTYQLNPSISMRSDIDDFLALYRTGRQAGGSATADLYEQACQLYKGPFLVDDLYADWSSPQRGQLSSIYLTMCNTLAEHYMEMRRFEDAMAWATDILKENHCDEAAHRHLMRAYTALGRRTEALRQYQYCQQTLFEELGVEPVHETVKLFHSLLSGEEGTQQ